MPSASCCFLLFHSTGNQYQTESKRSETFWRFFLDQKTRDGPKKYQRGAPRGAQPLGLFFIIFASRSIFICFCFQIYNSKNPKIPWCTFYLFNLLCSIERSIYPNYYKTIYLFTREGLTTPLLRRVARCCYLCATADYVVLLGSPTSSITLVSSLREIPTAVVQHHPFICGEIAT